VIKIRHIKKLHPQIRNRVIDALDQIAIKEPTEIQKEALPLALAGKNVIGWLISKCYDRKW